jgi:hypothetical protein
MAAILRRWCARRWPYSSQRSSSTGLCDTWLSLPIPKRAAGGEVGRQREQAVAEVRLGGRAQAGDGAAGRQRGRLGLRQVGRMHQAPARVDLDLVHQVSTGRCRRLQALPHFALLLGDVDVQRAPGRQRRHQLADLADGGRAQRMRRRAHFQLAAAQGSSASTMRSTWSGSVRKRCCSGFKGCSPKPA